MKRVECSTPWEQLENPPESVLRELILQKGEEYWQYNEGDGYLRYEDYERRSVLNVVLLEPFGFLLILRDKHGRAFSPVTLNDAPEIVSPIIGGEEWPVYRRNFVDREQAWLVVREFSVSGTMVGSCAWEPFGAAESVNED